ncbi:hypothetical protein RND71_009298 [Anisodus tanguticus]|uniref:Secreted protein n=1 Tax=Anisodus tanguticus TaxID=243964 RepID=A0AAE1SF71_9SOLA|nr:hypothetical protein RND71_009298 [Anisodus tanguticus]
MARMRQQRVWGFFLEWLPLSALPMILPSSTNQQPLKKRERKRYRTSVSGVPCISPLIQQQQQDAQCDPLGGIWGGWGVHSPYPYLG